VEILDKFKPDRWWWLATAHSTERHGNSSWAKCVSPSGGVSFGNCGGGVWRAPVLYFPIFYL
jgi:hypothetical protein